MFKILNGREQFYQWDLNQQLIVNDAYITEVHFSNSATGAALVCEVYEENGLRLVNVPNIILQDFWKIKVYGYLENFTKVEDCFEVIERAKPSDYVYTEVEIKNYEDLAKRIEELEKNGGGGSTNPELTPEDIEKITQDVIDAVGGEIESIARDAAGDLVGEEIEIAREEFAFMVPYKADLVSGDLVFKSNVNGRDYELFTADLPNYIDMNQVATYVNNQGFITEAAIPGIAEQAAALVDTNLLSAIGGGVLK
jgi:hypothetical protein